MNNHKQSAGWTATKASAAIFLSGCLLLGLAPAGFTQTIWKAQTADWFQPVNWSDGVPTSTTDAQINNGGTAQIGAGAAVANNVYLGFEASDTGNLLISGAASLQVANQLVVGDGGTGSLTIEGGAVVTDDIGGIGAFPDAATGSVVVDGVGSTWTNNSLSVGGFGVGNLMILDGGAVPGDGCSIAGSTHFGGGAGTVLVDGAGSRFSWNQTLEVEGSLTVQNGGAVVSNSATVDGGATLDGVDSSWTTGEMLVAAQDNASLTIRNGAILTSDDLAYISGGPFSGSVTVEGPGSRWNSDFDQVELLIGFGEFGLLNITNGGVVSTFAAEVAPDDGDDGQLQVGGSGSEFNVRSNLSIGGSDFVTGLVPGGVGLAQITNGGSISSATTTVFGQGTIVDDGTLTTELVAILSGGLLSGNGSVSGDVDSAGQIAPGDPLGTLAIVGNLTHAGKLVFEISGASSDAQGHLSITGDATLDGTVAVRFTDGFLPVQGQVFELIDVSGSVSGSFAAVIFPDLRSGFQFSTQFVNGRYQITALSDGAPAAGLLNISTRGQVGVDDDALIAGFIVTGTTDKEVVIRGLGPSLAAGGISLSDLLADPTLELRDQTGALITSSDNWMDSPQRQAIIDSMLAPSDDREAAILATLAPGSYTAILRGAGNGTGLGIVEVYNLGPDLSSSLANISTRGLVNTGDQVLIGGFIVDDQNSSVLLRGLGPSLTSAGVSDALANPTLELHGGNGDVIAFNDDWQQSDEAIIQNTGIPPTYSQESAILATLGPGQFTAILRGLNESTGIGLIEVYNLR
jgi:T5SS/PEP-CTERM-associated repeat protein